LHFDLNWCIFALRFFKQKTLIMKVKVKKLSASDLKKIKGGGYNAWAG
jgi:hypothetical protein